MKNEVKIHFDITKKIVSVINVNLIFENDEYYCKFESILPSYIYLNIAKKIDNLNL
jgi:hypothetical protein